MPRPKNLTPSYLCHKRSGQAFVVIDGKQISLGRHDSPESRQKYDQIVAQWLANGRKSPAAKQPEKADNRPTLASLILAYWEDYAAAGEAIAAEKASVRLTLRHLNHFFGAMPLEEFGPNSLRAFRDLMIKPLDYNHRTTGERFTSAVGWTRAHTGRQIGRIKRMFRWGVAHEMVAAAKLDALCKLEALPKHIETTPDRPLVVAVDKEHVQQIFDELSPQLQAILKLQLITGARGNELLTMRLKDIDTSRQTWIYAPSKHKTQWRGHAREIPLDPDCQEIIRPFMTGRAVDAYIFSPSEAEAGRRERMHEARKTPDNCGNRPGSNKSDAPKRPAGDRYTPASYRRAVQRACAKVFAPPADLARQQVPAKNRRTMKRWESKAEWRERLGPEKWSKLQQWMKSNRFHPHQIRHTVAQEFTREYGLDNCRAMLGWRDLKMPDRYKGHDRKVVLDIAEQWYKKRHEAEKASDGFKRKIG